VPHQFTTPINLKLNDDNFLIWKQQVLATIKDLKSIHFLDGSNLPLCYLNSQDEKDNLVNIEFLHHKQQDLLIVAWLLASMTTPFLTKMVGLETLTEIWMCLDT